MSIITVEDLCLWYGSSQALKNINIEIEPHSITARSDRPAAANPRF